MIGITVFVGTFNRFGSNMHRWSAVIKGHSKYIIDIVVVVVNACDCKIIFNADYKRIAVCISKCDNMIGQSLRVFSCTLTVVSLSFLFCIKIFQSKLHIYHLHCLFFYI